MFKKLLLTMFLLLSTLGFSQANSTAFGVQNTEASKGEVSFDTLNIHLDIPVVDKTGVGLPFSLGLHFNNNFWYNIPCPNGTSGSCWVPNASVFGWTPDAAQSYGAYIVVPATCGNSATNTNAMAFLGYMDSTGNIHPLPPSPGGSTDPWVFVQNAGNISCAYSNGAAFPTSASVLSTDSSGLTFNMAFPKGGENFQTDAVQLGSNVTVVATNGAVYTPGLAYTFQLGGDWHNPDLNNPYLPPSGFKVLWTPANYISGTSVVDANSNKISTPDQKSWAAHGVSPAGPYTYTDTLGVGEVAIAPETFTGPPAQSPNYVSPYGPKGPSGPCGGASETYTYPTSTGTASVTLACSLKTIQTNFGCSGVNEFPAGVYSVVNPGSNTFQTYTVDTITLADTSA